MPLILPLTIKAHNLRQKPLNYPKKHQEVWVLPFLHLVVGRLEDLLQELKHLY
jgi:hypothetical protein